MRARPAGDTRAAVAFRTKVVAVLPFPAGTMGEIDDNHAWLSANDLRRRSKMKDGTFNGAVAWGNGPEEIIPLEQSILSRTGKASVRKS